MTQQDITIENKITPLEVVLKAGQILLSSGAEIYRTEQTMNYMASALGLKTLEAYVSNRGIFATAHTENGCNESRIMNVPETDMNLDKIEAVNDVSRRISRENLSIDDVHLLLTTIDHTPDYSTIWKLIAYTFGAGGFSFAIGSSFLDSIGASIIGLILGIYLCYIKRYLSSTVLMTITGSILIALLGNLFTRIGLGSNLSVILLGAMMDLVPGVPFVNSVREFSENNYNTGLTLLMNALLTCVSIAVGVAGVQFFLAHTPMIPIYAANLEPISMVSMITRSLAAGLGTIAFAILFRVRREHFLDCALLGSITWLLFLLLSYLQSNVFIAVFLSGFIIAIASRILAVKRRCPVTVFLMTSLFPLLPGLSLYKSIYYMLMGQETIAVNFGKECFLTAFTIAISIAVVQQIKKWPFKI